MKTIKKLALKRETVRTLKVRAGIKTGGSFNATTTVVTKEDTKQNPPPWTADGACDQLAVSTNASIVSGVANASTTHLPASSVPMPASSGGGQ